MFLLKMIQKNFTEIIENDERKCKSVILYSISNSSEEWMHQFHHGIENASQPFPILITIGPFQRVFEI